MSKLEAELAINYGASALGLVGRMPSGPGVISDEMIYQIARIVPPPIATFLLTSETTVEGIIKHHQAVQTNTIQIVDRLTMGTYLEIRQALPAIKLVQVVHVINEHSIDEAQYISKDVDAILLDSGNPNQKIKELGGTGRVHNWKLSREIRESIDKPVFLAGGLTAENVKRAIEEVEPFGIDLCSSVRSNGKLDEMKLESFFKAALE
jgi:phosphoribosylanthranilate isomerase